MRQDPIRVFPDSVLRKICTPVTDFGPKSEALIRQMVDILKSQRHGIGIAAPQIGVSKRLAIVDVRPRVPSAEPLILINPEILEARDPQPSREGCMSLPDYTGLLNRFFWLRIRWQDERGLIREKVCVGIEAVCVQHEIDHLDGKLFMDRVASLKQDMIPRTLKSRK